MIADLLEAFRQFPDPAFRRVVVKAASWAGLLLAALVAFAWWGLDRIRLIGIGWLDGMVDVLGAAAALVAALLLFPGLAAAAVGFLLDDVVRAVEERHYPDLPPPRRLPLREGLAAAARLALATAALNLLLFPLYLVPGANVFAFYGVNGYLLGREYFELVALRRMDLAGARALRRRCRVRVFAGGVVIALLLSLPLAGVILAAPAAAFAVHRFERLRASAAADPGAAPG